MIWTWTLLALAATPDELAHAAEEATAQLERCSVAGCTSADGARAAFVAAVHTYQTEGVADGVLAATVEMLNPELFADLPDVLQQAATDPPAWTTRTKVADARRHIQDLLVGPTPWPYGEKPKLPRGTAEISITDREGAVVPSAAVRFLDEHLRHRVHTQHGTWSGTVRFLRDGSERFFQQGDELQLEVLAPGYRYHRATVVLAKRRTHPIELKLTPWTPESDGSPAADMTLEAYDAWLSCEAQILVSGPPAGADPHWTPCGPELLDTVVAAKHWSDVTGGNPTAKEICLLTGTIPYCEEGA